MCFEKYNLGNIFNGLGEGFDTLTRIFYTNIHNVNLDSLVFKAMINRKKILVDRELISKITKIPLGNFYIPRPNEENPSCETISYGLCRKKFDWIEGKFPTQDLSIALRIFGKIGIYNLCPFTIGNSRWSHEFAELVYFLEMGAQGLDICVFIILQMVLMTSSNKKLGFSWLIGKLCSAHSIAPIGNSIGTPKLVRPSIIKRMKMN